MDFSNFSIKGISTIFRVVVGDVSSPPLPPSITLLPPTPPLAPW